LPGVAARTTVAAEGAGLGVSQVAVVSVVISNAGFIRAVQVQRGIKASGEDRTVNEIALPGAAPAVAAAAHVMSILQIVVPVEKTAIGVIVCLIGIFSIFRGNYF